MEVMIVRKPRFATHAAILMFTGAIGACGSFDGAVTEDAGSTASVNESSLDGDRIDAVSKPVPTTASRRSIPNASTTTTATSSNPSDASATTAAASLKALPLGTLADSGPVVIDGGNGAVVKGRRISNPNGNCITVRNGATNVRIEGNQLGPCGGDGVSVQSGSNGVVVIGNNVSNAGAVAIMVADARGVKVHNNFIDGAPTAMRAVRSSQVEFEFNGGMNVRGRYPDGQLVQLDNVTGSGNRVRCNATDLNVGGPDPYSTTSTADWRTEDIINTWQSRGDPSDPILIAYNRLKGGGSLTGSGIMSGDGGGAYISVVGNRIVNPWNAGIGVAGGSNIRIESNKVFSEMPAVVAGEGFYIRNFSASACTNIVHQNNQILWPPADWSSSGWVQAFWQPQGECTNVTGTSTNNLNATSLSKAIFTEPIAECRALAAAAGLPTAGY